MPPARISDNTPQPHAIAALEKRNTPLHSPRPFPDFQHYMIQTINSNS